MVQAPCSSCTRKTAHEILFEHSSNEEDRITKYVVLECAGCGRICFAEQVLFRSGGDVENNFYPSPVARREPEWLLPMIVGLSGNKEVNAGLASLLHEIYQALHGNLYRLAAMGIRALLEQVIISEVGDHGSFTNNSHVFLERGYISSRQKKFLDETIDLGSAAIHRMHTPTASDINLALEITEAIMATLYHIPSKCKEMTARLPPRQRKGATKS